MTLRKLVSILVATLALFGIDAQSAYACKRVVVRQGDDLVKVFSGPRTKYVIKDNIDLKGKKVKIGERCTLLFQGGCLSNGTIEGTDTKINDTHNNIFKNCRIGGKWKVKCASSLMFDNNLDAGVLLRNLACLSPHLKLHANRTYYINENEIELDVETIEAASTEKPLLRFHTSNPDKEGLKIFGKNIVLRNIKFMDDYDEKNDAKYGLNKHTIGNLIAIRSRDKFVCTLTVEDCEFSGGTSSSYVASSQTRNCLVKNCTFSGYLGDHAIYCSKAVETFVVKDSRVRNVIHTRGLFKIRSSNNTKEFTIQNVNIHNLNGYLANVSLLETPNCELLFERIKVSKDVSDTSVFYGFCLNDETKILTGEKYNANSLVIKNCDFEYGYNGNPLIYHGAGKMAKIKTIKYIDTQMRHSNFTGGRVDDLIVNSCGFDECCTKKGMVPHAKRILVSNSKITVNQAGCANCLLLINYDRNCLKEISIVDSEIDARVTNMINFVKGNNIKVQMTNCKISSVKDSIFIMPDKNTVTFVGKGNVINEVCPLFCN